MNGTFSALMSTNEVYRDIDRTRCLTLDLDDLEAAVDDLETDLADHNHDATYIAKALQMVADSGGFKATITESVTTYLINAPIGIHTYYAASGVSGNPKTVEAWRFLVHKTDSSNNTWILAFGSEGSIYEGYINNGTWKGWHCLYDYSPVPLWSGEYYMTDTQTVTPSKTLSDCKNGWMLLWSDYNPGEGVGNTDFATTFIPKRAYNGQAWNGGKFLCAVPRYAEESSEAIIVKTLTVYDERLVGSSLNTEAYRNDCVLRAVYEF